MKDYKQPLNSLYASACLNVCVWLCVDYVCVLCVFPVASEEYVRGHWDRCVLFVFLFFFLTHMIHL